VIYKYNDKAERFSEWYKFICVFVGLALLSAVMFVFNVGGLTKNLWFETSFGVVIYLMSLVYWYGALLYDQEIDGKLNGARDALVDNKDESADAIRRGLEGFNP
jgi:hypothetical protein